MYENKYKQNIKIKSKHGERYKSDIYSRCYFLPQ